MSGPRVAEFVEQVLTEPFGYACELGAVDGVFGSNTLAYELKGWIVLCIEANPTLAPLGRNNRKLWRQVACGAEDQEAATFYAYADGPSISALKPTAAHIAMMPHITDVQEHTVKVRTLDRLLEEAGFPRLDYLSLDVEGGEGDVLRGFTIERWRPKVIVVEDVSGDEIVFPGYRHAGRHLYDNIWVRE